MKFLLPVCFWLAGITAFAQSKDHPLGLAAGGGPQYYYGDLGNGIKGDKDKVWRGAIVFNAAYYLNPSVDAMLYGSVGDLGYCQPDKVALTPVAEGEQCPGCEERKGLGNLNARLGAGGMGLRYKFNNGYLLKENSMLQPYVSLGVAVNNLTDRMKMDCINVGKYFSINAGAGVRYNVTRRVNLGYQLSTGYFTSDDLDFMSHGSSDMYIQSSLVLGINLF